MLRHFHVIKRLGRQETTRFLPFEMFFASKVDKSGRKSMKHGLLDFWALVFWPVFRSSRAWKAIFAGEIVLSINVNVCLNMCHKFDIKRLTQLILPASQSWTGAWWLHLISRAASHHGTKWNWMVLLTPWSNLSPQPLQLKPVKKCTTWNKSLGKLMPRLSCRSRNANAFFYLSHPVVANLGKRISF